MPQKLDGHGRSFSGNAPCPAPGPPIRTAAGARRQAVSSGRQQAFVPRRDSGGDGARGVDQAGGRPVRDHARGRIGPGSDSPALLSPQRALLRRGFSGPSAHLRAAGSCRPRLSTAGKYRWLCSTRVGRCARRAASSASSRIPAPRASTSSALRSGFISGKPSTAAFHPGPSRSRSITARPGSCVRSGAISRPTRSCSPSARLASASSAGCAPTCRPSATNATSICAISRNRSFPSTCRRTAAPPHPNLSLCMRPSTTFSPISFCVAPGDPPKIDRSGHE